MEGNMEMQASNIVKASGLKFWTLCSLVLLAACAKQKAQVPYFFTPDLSPTWTLNDSEQNDHQIAHFEFTDQDGQTFGSKQLKGKVYIVNFFFTSCPSICPTMTKNLSVIDKSFAKSNKIVLLSFSVTPELDSVRKLKEYHNTCEMSTNWHLLTGNQTEIYDLSRKSFFVEEEIGLSRDSSDFLHTERCMLIDQKGRIRGFYNATVAMDINRLADDIELILEEN
jgi:protein SCO1